MNQVTIVTIVGLVSALLAPVEGGSVTAGAASDPPRVYPTPEHIELGDTALRLASRVRVVTTENTDASALDALASMLRAEGVHTVDVAPSAASAHGKGAEFTVTLGQAGDAAVDAGLGTAELTVPDEAESYALAVDGATPTPSIVIGGADGAGQFYGVQTLLQLVQGTQGDAIVAGAKVVDRPAMPLRGTIEGFYGAPWTHADRLRQLGFLGAHKLNTYIYAPKDDPYHRELWREPYPVDKLAELAELVAAADDQHVAFWYAISPGVSVCYSGDDDFDALIAKSAQMWDVGVRSFALLLDDIDPALRCAADLDRFGAEESPAAAAQAHLLNRFKTEFLDARPGAARLMTVPTEYSQPSSPTPYTRNFATLVAPEVLVMWTGTSPFSTTGGGEVRAAREAYGHDVLMWDNYPVNDFATNRLFLGPLRGRGADVAEAGMVGYVSNPMNQAAASEIPLFTVADYTWNPAAYDPDTSWDAALREIGGGGYEALKLLAENSQSWYLDREESPDLVSAFDEFWRAYESGGSLTTAAAVVQARLDELENLPSALRRSLADESLLEDVGEHLDKLALLAEAANAATRMVLEQENGDANAAWQSRATTDSVLASAQAMPQEIASQWTEIGRPGRSIIDEFVARALRANESWLGLREDAGTHPVPEHVWEFDRQGDADGWVAGNSVGPVSVQDGALTTEVTGGDPYLSLLQPFSVIPSCRGVLFAEVTLGVDTGGRGQIYWATQERPGFGEDKTSTFEVNAGAPTTYRVEIATGSSPLTEMRLDLPDNAGQVRLDAVRIVVDRTEPAGTVTGGPPAVPGSSLDLAVDGCLATSWLAAREPQAGEALTVDLANPGPLVGVVILQDPKKPVGAEVQVRSGDTWLAVGSVDSGYGQVTTDGVSADAIRLVWAAGAEAPTVVEVIPFYANAATIAAELIGPPGGTVESGSSFAVGMRLSSTDLAPI